MLNTQQPEPQIEDNGKEIDIVKVWKTIQGEGPFAGTPAIFIRLAGCNIQCPACDTNYTSERKKLKWIEIDQWIHRVRQKDMIDLVVITGGEPFRQNIREMCEILVAKDMRVQIETNGIICPSDHNEWMESVTVVCSPKTPNIHRNLYRYIKALKYVLKDGEIDEDDGLPLRTLGRNTSVAKPYFSVAHPEEQPEIYVQPLDEQDEEKNKRNLDATLASAMKFGYRLCLQTHKIIGLE